VEVVNMSTQPVTAPDQTKGEPPKASKAQRTFFDLDTFTEVTVQKTFIPLPAVSTIAEAEARLGNDTARLLEIINVGLVAEQRTQQGSDPRGWKVMEEGEVTDNDFVGTPADMKKFNALRLTLAKTSAAPMLGLDWESASKVQKESIQEEALKLMRDTPMIRNGLKKSAAMKIEEIGAEGE
jgi:hypothetical protein